MISIVPVLLVIGATVIRGQEKAMVAVAFNKCLAQFPLEDGEMAQVKKKEEIPQSHNAKCLMACMLKEGRILTDGKYSVESAFMVADILNKDDRVIAEKCRTVIDTCAIEVGTDASADECEFAYKMAICASGEAKKAGIRPPDF